jgi:hypothetical protein
MNRKFALALATVFVCIRGALAQTQPTTAPLFKPIIPAVAPFNLDQVELLDGPFKQAEERDKAYLLSLDPDRLLHNFRMNVGLPSSAEKL